MYRLVFRCVSVFFFKQKTAYEMLISDWSSDVCSFRSTTTRSRRPNGEDIGPKDAPRGLVALASGFRTEMEAIWASPQLSERGDLIKMAHCFVEKSRNIDIFLRLLSSPCAILLQTSIAWSLSTDPTAHAVPFVPCATSPSRSGPAR